jgi:5-bromo-4-chloroindolyl phosphate hydrolysis protein
MKPYPFLVLNHLTVPIAIIYSFVFIYYYLTSKQAMKLELTKSAFDEKEIKYIKQGIDY